MKTLNYIRKDCKEYKYILNTFISIIKQSNKEIKWFFDFEGTFINLKASLTVYKYKIPFSYKPIYFVSLDTFKLKKDFTAGGDSFEKEFQDIFWEWFYSEGLFIKFNSSKKELEKILQSLEKEEKRVFNLGDSVKYISAGWDIYYWIITAFIFNKNENKYLYKTSFTEDFIEGYKYKEAKYFETLK